MGMKEYPVTICAYCKSRVFPTDRKCPACGSRVFVNLEEASHAAEIPPEPRAYAQAPAVEPKVVYQTIHQTVYVRPQKSERSRWVALLLCFLGGPLGLHRFYVGKIGSGILYLFTAGVCFFGAVVDFFTILVGSFRDKDGLPLR